MISIIALVMQALSFCPVSASTPTNLNSEADVQTFIDHYVDLSNARDLDGLLTLYVQSPLIIQKRKRIDGDFAKKLAENMETWDDYKVVFSKGDVKNIDLQAEKAFVEFELKGRGRFLGFSVTRRVIKALTIVRAGEDWKITEDVTSSFKKSSPRRPTVMP
jgi:hypothetical protein